MDPFVGHQKRYGSVGKAPWGGSAGATVVNELVFFFMKR